MKKVIISQILSICLLLPAFGQQNNGSIDHQNSEKVPNEWLSINYAGALDAFEQKLYVTALRGFENVRLQADSSFADLGNVWYYIGRCQYQLFEFDKAIEAYQTAAAFSPEIKTQDYYSHIGMAYVGNRQYEKARIAFTEYEKLYPAEGETHKNWAMYYALQKDREKALSCLQKAVELGYDDVEWLKTDSSMYGLRMDKTYLQILEKMEKEREAKQEGI